MLPRIVLITSILCLISAQNAAAAPDTVLCYFQSWAVYRTGHAVYHPEDIDVKTCTHILYAFLSVNGQGNLVILDEWAEVGLGGLKKVAALKKSNEKLKVLVSIGGWSAGHPLLATVITSSSLRKAFIDSCIAFFEKYDFDGLDIMWEYPTAADEKNFATLIEETKMAFGSDYVLSVGIPGVPIAGYDAKTISANVDFVNVMAYDFHAYYDGVTGHNAPLYSGNTVSPAGTARSVNESIRAWIDLGFSASKINLGIAFYGHTFTLTSAENNRPGDAVSGAAPPGPYTQEPGVLSYNEICEYYDDYTRVWDEDAQASYQYKDLIWISSDDRRTIGLKVKYATDMKLAGFMVWTVDIDDFSGICGGSKYPLLEALGKSIKQ